MVGVCNLPVVSQMNPFIFLEDYIRQEIVHLHVASVYYHALRPFKNKKVSVCSFPHLLKKCYSAMVV